MEQRPITPNLWGPHGWKFLHYVTLGYPMNPTENDKQNYKMFFSSLQSVLPCSKCSENFKQNLKDYPIEPALENRDSLIKWFIDIHNSVNNELNKPELEYEKAIQLYLQDQPPYLDYCFKIAVLVCLLYFIYHYLKKK
jgi:hypothetical protein